MKVALIFCLSLSLTLIGCVGDDSDGNDTDSGVLDLGGLVGDDATSTDGVEIENPCGDWKCTGPDCGKLVAMPGPHAPAQAEEADEHGYVLVSGKEYHFVRKDLAQLLTWAICEVRVKFPDVTPIAVADMSQQDGKTPGVDTGRPRHPTTTHVNGRDIDIAYYQTDGANDYQIICGDGSDKNNNGQPAKFNDGYFCTTNQNIVDWGPQVWFLAKLIEAPNKARVFGVDQMLVKDMGNKLKEFYDNGEISKDLYMKFNKQIAWGAAGGWQFHHHHIHLSFMGYTP